MVALSVQLSNVKKADEGRDALPRRLLKGLLLNGFGLTLERLIILPRRRMNIGGVFVVNSGVTFRGFQSADQHRSSIKHVSFRERNGTRVAIS